MENPSKNIYFQQQIKLFNLLEKFFFDKFIIKHWSIFLDSGDSNFMGSINYVSKLKELMMYYPNPNDTSTYIILNHQLGNPFRLVSGLDFVKGGLSADQVKIYLNKNLTDSSPKIIILFPNPRSQDIDIYSIKTPILDTNNDQTTQCSHTTKDNILEAFDLEAFRP